MALAVGAQFLALAMIWLSGSVLHTVKTKDHQHLKFLVELVLVLGVYFTGQSQSARLAYAIYAIVAGAQAICAALVMSGAMHDPGLIQADLIGRSSQLVIQGLVQVVMLGAIGNFVMAVQSRSVPVCFGRKTPRMRQAMIPGLMLNAGAALVSVSLLPLNDALGSRLEGVGLLLGGAALAWLAPGAGSVWG